MKMTRYIYYISILLLFVGCNSEFKKITTTKQGNGVLLCVIDNVTDEYIFIKPIQAWISNIHLQKTASGKYMVKQVDNKTDSEITWKESELIRILNVKCDKCDKYFRLSKLSTDTFSKSLLNEKSKKNLNQLTIGDNVIITYYSNDDKTNKIGAVYTVKNNRLKILNTKLSRCLPITFKY